MKILVSAYACEPGRGSEGEIGWRMVRALAAEHEVWVITRANLRAVHERAFASEGRPGNLHFVYFDLPWILRFYKRGKRLFLVYYYLWQLGIAVQAWKLRGKRFDLMHHLIGGMDWMPSGLALLPGPFLWGPVGSENTPAVIRRQLSLISRVADASRLVIRWWMRTMDPMVRLTRARASVILSHTPENMPSRCASKVRAFTQTGIHASSDLALPKRSFERAQSLRIVFAGDLKEWKGARFAVQAALRLFEARPDADMHVIGDGPLRDELHRLVAAHPHGQRVTFLGKLPMRDLLRELHDGDVFIYPSFHHGLATVVLQAMLTGLPVVCIEGDATGRIIGSTAGITVPLRDGCKPEHDLAEALGQLASDEPRRRRLAVAARDVALRDYDYGELAHRLTQVYQDIRFGQALSARSSTHERREHI
jgi:glycosyltransferase involved in cell wall biosynthesis